MFELSVKDIKNVLDIKTTEKDNYIETMLPIVIDLVEKHCGTEFVQRTENGIYKKINENYIINEIGLIIIIAKIIEFYMNTAGISYEAIGKVTYTYSNELPKSILDSLKLYSKGRINFI